MTSSRLVFAVAMLLTSLATSAEANRFADNPEFVIDRKSEAWTGPIGELQSIRQKVERRDTQTATITNAGTGFLVSPCYVLTAAHVVYGDDLTPVPGTDYRMKFRAGTGVTSPFAGNTTATPVASGFRDEGGRNDWALLRLNNCIGKRSEIGWLETSEAHLPNRQDNRAVADAVALGYATLKERGNLSAESGTLTYEERNSGLKIFTGSMNPGESGGPVMILENGLLNVFALNKGSSATGLSMVQSIYEVVNRPNVKAMLDQDKAEWGLPNPNLPRLRMSLLPQRM